MFDTYTLGRTEYVPYEKSVTITKPSTAEELKLLRKMEKEAMDSIISVNKVNMGDNLFEGVIYHYKDHTISFDSDKFKLVVKVNGQEVSVDVKVSRYDLPPESHEMEKVQLGYNKLVEKFAAKLIAANFDEMYKKI